MVLLVAVGVPVGGVVAFADFRIFYRWNLRRGSGCVECRQAQMSAQIYQANRANVGGRVRLHFHFVLLCLRKFLAVVVALVGAAKLAHLSAD